MVQSDSIYISKKYCNLNLARLAQTRNPSGSTVTLRNPRNDGCEFLVIWVVNSSQEEILFIDL